MTVPKPPFDSIISPYGTVISTVWYCHIDVTFSDFIENRGVRKLRSLIRGTNGYIPTMTWLNKAATAKPATVDSVVAYKTATACETAYLKKE